jgi:DNA-binding transcriptional LysR family regulator
MARVIPIDALIAFVSITETGSINRAAATLNISQPSLTRMVQQLENVVGGELFHRSSKGVALTSLGSALLGQASLVRTEARKVQLMVDQLRQQRQAEFHIGLVPAEHPLEVLTQAIIDFTKTHTKVKVHLHTGGLAGLLDEMRDGRIELIVGPITDGFDRRSVVADHLYYDVTELCCRAGHPLAKKSVKLDDLTKAEWVLGPPGSPSRQRVSQVLEDSAGAHPKIRIEVENILIRLSLVRQSDLLSVFDLHHVSDDLQRNKLTRLRFDWSQQRRSMGILRARNPSQLARLFVSTLRSRYMGSGLPMR